MDTVEERYLGSSPVNPSLAIGVDVEQNQTLYQLREDQLSVKDNRIVLHTEMEMLLLFHK